MPKHEYSHKIIIENASSTLKLLCMMVWIIFLTKYGSLKERRKRISCKFLSELIVQWVSGKIDQKNYREVENGKL